jgi:ElaB/YqjD/DUF883 family membrane-anchored ribosome-binding protein
MTSEAVTKEKLAEDVKVVVRDAEVLLRETAGQLGEKAKEARERLERGIAIARERLAEIQKTSVEKAKVAAKATDEFVHEHPWKSVGIAFVVGIALGVLIGRR